MSVEIVNGAVFLSEETVTLSFGGSAKPEEDYSTSGSEIVIPLGASTGASEVVVAAIDDGRVEGDETIIVTATLAGTVFGTETITIDDNDDGPSAVVASDAVAPVAGAFEVSISFSDGVTDFGVDGLEVSGGQASALAGSGSEYTALITPLGEGTREVSVQVLAGVARDASENWNTASNRFVIAVDLMRPTVHLSSGAEEPIPGAFEVSITFSEPVSGFDIAGLLVTNAEAANLAGGGADYTALITPSRDFEGVVSVQVMAHVAQDQAGNGNLESTPHQVMVDTLAPRASVSASMSDQIVGAFEVSITFSEAVSGFDVGGVRVSNGEVTGLSGSGADYRARITPSPGLRGEVSVWVPAFAAFDAAGNGNLPSPSLVVTAFLNEPPRFEQEAYAFDLPENVAGPLMLGLVSAVDPDDGDRLSYEILGSDRELFAIGEDGALSYVGSGEDYESGPTSFEFTVRVADGSMMAATATVVVAVLNLDEAGTVELSSLTAEVGEELTASLHDPDGGVTDVHWHWQRSRSTVWEDISGAVSASYAPATADVGWRLRAVASYRDAEGPDKEARSLPTEPVVIPSDERAAAVEVALSGLGRMLASNAVDAIGSRFEGRFAGQSSATVYGYRVPLGAEANGSVGGSGFRLAPASPFGGPSGANGWNAGGSLFSGPGWSQGLGSGTFPGGGVSAGSGFGTGRQTPGRHGSSFWELLSRSSFELYFGGDASADSELAGAQRPWTFWGRGDQGSFRGRAYDVDGRTNTVYLGVDRRRGGNVYGLALSRSRGDIAYSGELSGRGAVEADLVTVLPYAQWSLRPGLSAWALLGAGTGEVELSDAQDESLSANLTRELVAGGVRKDLRTGSVYGLALKGDVFGTRLTTERQEGLPSLSAGAYRARVLLEGRADWSLSEHGRLSPVVEVGGRLDGGDSASGLGTELGARVRYTNIASGLEVEARGRYLAAHEEQGFGAWGAGLTVRLGGQENGLGLGGSFAPTWGALSSGGNALWRADGSRPLFSNAGNAASAAPSWLPTRSELRLHYGFESWGGVVTPFAVLGLEGTTASRSQLGARFDLKSSLRLELVAERAERVGGNAAHTAGLHVNYVIGRRSGRRAALAPRLTPGS